MTFSIVTMNAPTNKFLKILRYLLIIPTFICLISCFSLVKKIKGYKIQQVRKFPCKQFFYVIESNLKLALYNSAETQIIYQTDQNLFVPLQDIGTCYFAQLIKVRQNHNYICLNAIIDLLRINKNQKMPIHIQIISYFLFVPDDLLQTKYLIIRTNKQKNQFNQFLRQICQSLNVSLKFDIIYTNTKIDTIYGIFNIFSANLHKICKQKPRILQQISTNALKPPTYNYTNQKPIKLPTSATPLMQKFNQSFVLIQYLNVLEYLSQPVYNFTRKYLQSYYPLSVIGSDLYRVASGQNQSHIIYKLTYKIYTLTQDYQHFIFALAKQTAQLSLLSRYLVPLSGRNIQYLDESNRRELINKQQEYIKKLINEQVIKSSYYLSQSQIFQITKLQIDLGATLPNRIVNGLELVNNVLLTNQTQNISLVLLKYYNFAMFNVSYQYVEFMYQINKSNPLLSTPQLITLFPPQNFVPVTQDIDIINQSLTFYISQFIVPQLSPFNFVLLQFLKSQQKQELYKVKILAENQTLFTYFIDSTNAIKPRLLSIQSHRRSPWSINTQASTTLQTNQSNSFSSSSSSSSSSLSPISSITPQQTNQITPSNMSIQFVSSQNISIVVPQQKITTYSQFNMTNFFEKFPKRQPIQTNMPLQSIFTPNDPTQLKQNQLKLYLSLLFKIAPDYFINIKIINRTSIRGWLDTYLIQYTQILSVKNQTKNIKPSLNIKESRKCRLKFQVVPKKTNLVLRSAFYDNLTLTINPSINRGLTLDYNQTTLPQTEVLNKNIKVLSQIFDTKFKVQANIDNKVNISKRVPQISLKFPTSLATNSTDITIQDFLTNLPKILPLKFKQNPDTPDLQTAPLSNIQKNLISPIVLTNQQIAFPAAYSQGLATVQLRRFFQNSSNLQMIQVNHVYYGTIRMWGTLTKITQIKYADEGYLFTSTNNAILKSVPDLRSTHKIISTQITNILSIFSYRQDWSYIAFTSNIKSFLNKVVTESDIILWKYKTITGISMLMIYYQFNGFVIRCEVIINRKSQNSSNKQISFTLLQAIPNKSSRLKKIKQSKITTEQTTRRPQFKEVMKAVLNNYKYALNQSILEYANATQLNGSLIFNLQFSTTSNRVEMALAYSNNTKKVSIINKLAPSAPARIIIGCKKLNLISQNKCSQCLINYYLNLKDFQCYQKIDHCSIQSGQLCLACQTGFILSIKYVCL